MSGYALFGKIVPRHDPGISKLRASAAMAGRRATIQQLNFWGTNMLKSLCSNNAVMFYFNRIPLLNGRSEQGANRSAELTAEAFRNEDNAFLPLRRRPLSVR